MAEAPTVEAPARLPLARGSKFKRWRGWGDAVFVAPFRDHDALAPFVLYLVIACLFELPAVRHMNSRCACGYGSDPTQYMWAMQWWPYAIAHGVNPFWTHEIWFDPSGMDLASATSIPGLALIASPITVVAGPLVAFNIVSILAPVTAAWFAYRLCLYITKAPLPSLVGGYLFGFSAYEFGQLLGHMHLTVIFAIPAAVLLTLKRFDGVIGRARYVILTGLVLAIQLSISTEVAFTFTLMILATLVCALALSRPEARRRIVRLLPDLAGAYVVMGILCLPFLYYALKGPPLNVNGNFPADGLGFFFPTQTMRVGGHWFLPVSQSYPGNSSEQGTYLGLPLLLIVVAYAVRTWGRRTTRVLIAALAVAVIWALGDHLYIAGRPTIPLPWKLVSHLPLFDQLITARIGLYISLICAVIAALWIASTRPSALWRWSLAGLAVIFLIPRVDASYPGSDLSLYHASETIPSFFTSGLYRRYLRPNAVVMPLPFANTNGAQNLLWQADTDMYFRLASGYFGYTPPDYNSTLLPALLGGSALPLDAPAQLRTFLGVHTVDDVVADPSTAGGWLQVLARIGLRPIRVGGVLVYRVPAAWRAPRPI
ncbi:MAG TPA: hypothetical protein VMD09_18120 [Solirubrobacteraceae bacterium]|nr:hypothetical protein [Solirubrobacteraceae bacterium]